METALVTGGLFRFWNTEWPVPGGTAFKVAVYDASGPDGAPGKKIAGPFDGTALRNGEWTHVDLSEHGIMVDGDFYMVYIQSAPNPNALDLGRMRMVKMQPEAGNSLVEHGLRPRRMKGTT